MILNKLAAAIVCLQSGTVFAAPNNIRGGGTKDAPSSRQLQGRNQHDVLETDQWGTYFIAEYDYEQGDQSSASGNSKKKKKKQTMNVELDNGLIYTLNGVDPSWAEQAKNGRGKIKSGHSKIRIPGGSNVSGGTIDLKGSAPVVGYGKGKNKDQHGRNLQSLPNPLTHGEKTVLVVRVVAADGASYSSSETELSNFVFGNGVDQSNLVSRYDACSYGKLSFVKAANRQMANPPADATTNIVNGVLTVQVDTALASDGDEIMRNAVTQKIKAVYGTAPKNIATHVIYCLPPGTLDGLAYATLNGWVSVYNDENCNYASIQVHEIGHNLDFGHSGETAEYDDMTGLMGFSYTVNDGPEMCLNPSKSYQTDWYDASTHTISPTLGANGVNLDTCFSGSLYGIADYIGSADRTVLIKINDTRPDVDDYFISFNRMTGINSETKEAADQVVITTAGMEGDAYSESDLVAKLSAGETYTISNFEGTDKDVVIYVESIDLVSTPGYARVSIEYAGVPCAEAPPTPAPTMCQGKTVEIDITTDNWPTETSWSLTNTCTQEVVAERPEQFFKEAGTAYPTEALCVDDGAYTFTIRDTPYMDGMCCNYGSGSYKVTLDGLTIASGGEFKDQESNSFGSCVASPSTPPPSVSPTKQPTRQQTSPPTTGLVQCPGNQLPIDIKLKTDNWPTETSWFLTNTCHNT